MGGGIELNGNFRLNSLIDWDILPAHYGNERYSIDVDKTNHTITINVAGIASGAPAYTLATNISTTHKIAIIGIDALSGTKQSIYDGGSPATSTDRIRLQNYSNNLFLRIDMSVVIENLVISPMFIDLTDMFGAGNEPTTIAEVKRWFRASQIPYNTGQNGKLIFQPTE